MKKICAVIALSVLFSGSSIAGVLTINNNPSSGQYLTPAAAESAALAGETCSVINDKRLSLIGNGHEPIMPDPAPGKPGAINLSETSTSLYDINIVGLDINSIHNNAADIHPHFVSGFKIRSCTNICLNFTGATTIENGYALPFLVSNFSKLFRARTSAAVLSLQSIILEAKKQGDTVQLHWYTDEENPTDIYRLMRGAGSTDLLSIVTIPAGSQAFNDYVFPDTAPLPGTSYYRVVLEGKDGSLLYSSTVVVRMGAGNIITISPNPASNVLNVKGVEDGRQISLTDMAGKSVWQGSAGGNSLAIKTNGFAAGVYMLAIEGSAGSRIVQRIEIVH